MSGKIIFDKGETSHASQAKTVDQVIASVPVRSFNQANGTILRHDVACEVDYACLY
jgi:hypothetical protein